MKNTKKKALVSAILTIALCFSVIAGATFALFTSNDEVNIAVTSGKVNLTAFINEATLKTTSLGVEQPVGKFAVGGTATFDAKSDLTLTNIVPGDKATFEIDVTNNSNVDVMYKLTWKVNNDEMDALVATATVKGTTENITATEWTKWTTPATDAEKVQTLVASIELPREAGNDYQDKSASITFAVEAVQANAVVEKVSTADQLITAMTVGVNNISLDADIQLPETLVVPEGAIATLNLNGKTLTAEGALLDNYGTLTIEGDGTLDVSASTGKAQAINNYGTLTLNGGTYKGTEALYSYTIRNFATMTANDAELVGGFGGLSVEGKTVINDGDYTLTGNDGGHLVYLYGNGDLTVNGGKFYDSINDPTIWTYSFYMNGANTKVTVNGGEITGLTTGRGTTVNGGSGTFVINGGTVNGKFFANSQGGKTIIYGGTFNENPEAFVAKYFLATDNGDGTYTVAPKANVTVVKTVADFAALSAKAFTGNNNTAETWNIVLFSDIDMNGADFSAMIAQRGDTLNFDGNGYKISNVNLVSGENDNTTGQSSLFYAYPNSTLNVSDLVIENANSVTDNNDWGYGAIVVGYCEGTANITDVDLVNCNVLGAKSSGMIAGHMSGALNVKDCTITKGTVVIREDTVEAKGHYAGKVVGTVAGAFEISNTEYDVTVSGKLHANNVGELYGRKVSGALKIDGYNQVAGDEASSAISGGGNVGLTSDVTYSSKIEKDVNIDLNGNTFEAQGTINLGNNADLTMKGGDYEVNGTYGHVDVRPSSAEGSVVTFENVDFSYNKLEKTYGPSTNRLGSVVEVCAAVADAKSTVVFKNCTFDNAMVLIEGMSGKTGEVDVTFEGCTFNALTSSAPIKVDNFVKGTVTVKGCTFNLICTSSTASAVSVSPSSSTTITLNAENNTINATAATPYTYNPELGETEVHNVKVNGTPKNIKFASVYDNATANITGTTATGIAIA